METFDNITLHHGDCMDVMQGLDDGAFDLAIVDPPYFSGPERRQFYGCRISKIGVKRLYAKSKKWVIPTAEYFDELKRVAKYYIVWGCNYFDYHFAPGRIVWDKCNGASSFSDCEIAATNLISSVRLFLSAPSDCSRSCGTECCRVRVSLTGVRCRATRL